MHACTHPVIWGLRGTHVASAQQALRSPFSSTVSGDSFGGGGGTSRWRRLSRGPSWLPLSAARWARVWNSTREIFRNASFRHPESERPWAQARGAPVAPLTLAGAAGVRPREQAARGSDPPDRGCLLWGQVALSPRTWDGRRIRVGCERSRCFPLESLFADLCPRLVFFKPQPLGLDLRRPSPHSASLMSDVCVWAGRSRVKTHHLGSVSHARRYTPCGGVGRERALWVPAGGASWCPPRFSRRPSLKVNNILSFTFQSGKAEEGLPARPAALCRGLAGAAARRQPAFMQEARIPEHRLREAFCPEPRGRCTR